MKKIAFGFLALFSTNLIAQNMTNPKNTVIGLFVATDQKNWEQVERYFHDQVLLDYSSMTGDQAAQLAPEQIIAAWKTVLPGFDHTHHQIGNFISNEEGSEAQVFCYGTASHFLNDEGGNIWQVVGTYDFKLEKIKSGVWKITSMKFNFKYQDGNTSLPEKAINKLK